MKSTVLISALIITMGSCGPTKQDEIAAADKTATFVTGNGNMNVKINTVVHEKKRYVVACYKNSVCIIPEPND